MWMFFKLKKRKARWSLVGVSALSAAVLAGWLAYMQYLNKTYNSVIFLAQAMPLGTSSPPPPHC
ncbi:MAG: hypothetical protein R3B47_16840 [Bacteroidia bacterium]